MSLITISKRIRCNDPYSSWRKTWHQEVHENCYCVLAFVKKFFAPYFKRLMSVLYCDFWENQLKRSENNCFISEVFQRPLIGRFFNRRVRDCQNRFIPWNTFTAYCNFLWVWSLFNFIQNFYQIETYSNKEKKKGICSNHAWFKSSLKNQVFSTVISFSLSKLAAWFVLR